MIISQQILHRLLEQPECIHATTLCGMPCGLSFGIAHYDQHIQTRYGNRPTQFQHFGLKLCFEQAVELDLHKEDMLLSSSIKSALHQYGLILIKNAYLPAAVRGVGHRNRFPHLSFHRDRSEHHATPYSLFYRDPNDKDQRHPRTSSTLFVSNAVANLELNGCCISESISQCMLFEAIDEEHRMSELLGTIVIEQRWDEPLETGEICIQDNRSLMHSSYYRNVMQDGYRIGVRYLG